MKKLLTIAFLPLITVSSALAAVDGGPILSMIALVQEIVVRLVPLAIGLAVLAFFWYLIQFIWSGKDGDGEKRKGSMAGMGYSIFAIFVMVSIWGIVYFIAGIVGVTPGGTMSGFKLPGEQ
jgi:hypothetical protein